MSSFQEVVFNNNVIVRCIVSYLMDGYVDILNIALINRTFFAETCSKVLKIRSLSFFNIERAPNDDLDVTQPDDDEEYEKMITPKYGFELAKIPSIFESNLKFVSQNAPIESIDFSNVVLRCKLTPLTELTGTYLK